MLISIPYKSTMTDEEEALYPSSDGKPMGETDFHVKYMLYCWGILNIFFADRPDVYVAGNNFLYFEQGNPKAVVSPDSYVVFGVEKHLRDTFMTWKEGGRLPSYVMEITSRKTRRQDVAVKRPLYERLGVTEYFQFDPKGDYLKPRLQGLRLIEGSYVPIPAQNGQVLSRVLGLELAVIEDHIRFYDPVTATWLPTFEEMNTMTLDLEARLKIEAMRVAEETARANREAGRAVIERERARQEAERARQEAERARQEAERADSEAARAQELQRELDRLRAQLADRETDDKN